MKPISTVTIAPSLPDELKELEALAYDLRWAWDPEAIELFRRIDRGLWEDVYHNPVRVLGSIGQERLRELTENPGFLAHLRRCVESLETYREESTWFQRTYGDPKGVCVGYFSAEFGITEALPIYSGGLGVLAGDHLKSASDLGIPLVGVGLLYQRGYFRQYLNNDGWQQEDETENDFYTLPVQPVQAGGQDVTVEVDFPDGRAAVRIWKAQVGRVPLFLLDTNLEGNPQGIRTITAQLYSGDGEMRLRQEILLGVGGFRALDALKMRPAVCHMNEGHSAFLAVERIRTAMVEGGVDFDVAREMVAAGNVFTTHTPVPAGHDVFPPSLVERYFGAVAAELGLPIQAFLDLGRQQPGNAQDGFNMTVLALRNSAFRNGVSQLHGQVSRRMCQGLWPGVPEDEIPVTSITNGIHVPSWISHGLASLHQTYLGPRLLEEPEDQSVWERVADIPPEELWRTHERRRERLVAFARRRLREQLGRRSASPVEIARADEVLDPKALTIGFARRFATYKRATLLLRDPERLTRILCNEERPVQIIYAGKAHPQDMAGKEFIREIVHVIQREDLRRRIVFVEDYDMSVARYLVQGVDIWLNTPLRPLEASGTSGMKATANGALNLSVLDGWWAEAYKVDVGWAIGRGEEYDDPAYQDQVEADALYQILENDAVPLFYDRGPDGLPRGWVARMKSALSSLCPVFNTHRMVHEYTEKAYLPTQKRYQKLAARKGVGARDLADWRGRVQTAWAGVKILEVESDPVRHPCVGDRIEVRAHVRLGDLDAADVSVELYYGRLDAQGGIDGGRGVAMSPVRGGSDDGGLWFSGNMPCERSGRSGYTVRVTPTHKNAASLFDTGLIAWA